MSAVLEARGLAKNYVGGDGQPIRVLQDLDLSVEAGEFIAVVGSSGSGKSTLLHLLGALDQPTAGEVAIDGQRLAELDVETLAALRNRRIGFVFQFHHLLRDFTALENAMMPLLIGGMSEPDAERRAKETLVALGLEPRIGHYPAQLSGGEQQRVAIGRALATHPAIILADEPSGNLDPANATVLHELLASVRDRFRTAVVVATHNWDLARRADRILRLDGGVLIPERHSSEAVPG